MKTSTGFGPGGATVDVIALMRQTVGPDMGVKASGGVRDLAAVRSLIAAGATRSVLAQALLSSAARKAKGINSKGSKFYADLLIKAIG